MKYMYQYLDETLYKYKVNTQYLEMGVLALLGFLIPFTLGHPQILVGAVVNAFIIRSALTLPRYKALPIIFTPTLGVLARGILFGPFTPAVAILAPAIWIGNYILLYAFKLKIKTKINYFLTLFAGACAKALFLYTTAILLNSAGLIPTPLITAMGILQLTTAIVGGILVYSELKIEKIFRK